MKFKKVKLVSRVPINATCQGKLLTTTENIDIYDNNKVIRYYQYSIYHFNDIDGIHSLNSIGQKIYNQLTGYKEELTSS